MYTISKLKNDLTGILKGTTTDKITNLNEVFNRAARECLKDNDFAETRRTQQITNAIYDSVYDYTLPSDLKGNKIIDVIKQVNRSRKFQSTGVESFGFSTGDSTFNIKHNSGIKTLKLSASLSAGLTLHPCNTLTGDGTWSATSNSTNLTLDTQNYVSGGASLNFDVDGATTTGYIENSDFTAIDASDHEDKSGIFLWLYIPDSSAFTSVNLRWGSSSSAYWNVTATSAQDGSFQTGWNLVRFDWNGATENGSPDSSALNYLRVTITYDGTVDTDFRVDSIVSRIGDIFSLDYYSKFLFRTSGGTWQEETSADSDIINLDTDSYNVYLFKVAEFSFAQLGNKKVDEEKYLGKYEDASRDYRTIYKSEAKKQKEVYYSLFRRQDTTRTTTRRI